MRQHLPDDDHCGLTPTRSPASPTSGSTGSSPAASTRCCGITGGRGAELRRRRLQDQPDPSRRSERRSSTEAMAAEMMASHHPLQALLYSVALHRYLRWRLPGYSAGTSLGSRAIPLRARHDRSGHSVRLRRIPVGRAGRARRRPVRPVGGVHRERRRRTAGTDAAAARLAVAETGFLRLQ